MYSPYYLLSMSLFYIIELNILHITNRKINILLHIIGSSYG